MRCEIARRCRRDIMTALISAKSFSLTLPFVRISNSKKQFSTMSPTVNKFPRITLTSRATHALQKSAMSPGRSSTCILNSVAFATTSLLNITPP